MIGAAQRGKSVITVAIVTREDDEHILTRNPVDRGK